MAYNTGLSLSDFRPRSRMQGGAAAAGNATVSSNFSALQRSKPDWAAFGQRQIQAAGYKERGINDANTAVLNQRMASEASIKAARLTADAQKDAARAEARGSMVGSIARAGVGLLGAVLSDERTKNTIESIEDALSTLRQLKPVTYYYNEEYSSSPERIHHGFIAQDYAKVLPAATYYDDSVDRLCIDTGELIALLVRAVQQLETRVTRMEAKAALVEV